MTKKIAHLICRFPPYRSGMSTAAHDLAVFNLKMGHDVTVFTPDYASSERFAENDSLKVSYLKPLLRYGNAAFIPQIALKLEKYDIAILHYPFFGAAEAVYFAKLFGRIQRLAVFYHMDTPRLSSVARIFSLPDRLLKSGLINRADAIFCSSLNYIKSSTLALYYENKPEKFFEIPFSVDTGIFHPAKVDKGKKSDKRKILFVGALDKAHAFKGIDVLIKAMSELKNEKFDWQLQIVGEGDLRAEYEEQARLAGLERQVSFLGSVPPQAKPQIFRDADVFVLPSVSSNEAFGIVLLEAMASGVPVIATDLPGVRSVFADGRQGFLARRGDASDLADKIRMILSNHDLRKRMGDSARELALSKYSTDAIAEKFENALGSVVLS